MVTVEQSIPRKGSNYLKAQDIFWTQFNDINFYVEDEDQENFYFQVLRKLFPDISLNKIFPLNGKLNVIDGARNAIGEKNKVFLLDLDFDKILKKKLVLDNLFYLSRYSIENYLIEEDAIHEVIIEENPKKNKEKLKKDFPYNTYWQENCNLFHDLACHYLLISKFELGVPYMKVDIGRDCDLSKEPCVLKVDIASKFFKEVENELKIKRPKMKYSRQIKLVRKHFRSIRNVQSNVPGKLLLLLLNAKLKRQKLISQMKLESFCFRLAKNCSFEDLVYLREGIKKYIA